MAKDDDDALASDDTTEATDSDRDSGQKKSPNKLVTPKKKTKKKVKKKTVVDSGEVPEHDGQDDDDWAPVRIGRSQLHPNVSFRDRTGLQRHLGANVVNHQQRLSVSVGPVMLTQLDSSSEDFSNQMENLANKVVAAAEPEAVPEPNPISVERSSQSPKRDVSPIYVCV